MVEKIYEQLKTPKTIEEIYERINEVGVKWNISQIQLFLEMDKNIVNNGDLYSINGIDKEELVLNEIERIIGLKPMIPIKQIISNISSDIIVSPEEIRKIAIDSGKYISPNLSVLKKVN